MSTLKVNNINTVTGSPVSVACAFFAELASSYTISPSTYVQNTGLTANEIDTHNAFASSTFTVPSGQAGLYKLYYVAYIDFDGIGDDGRSSRAAIYKNGSVIANYDLTDSGNDSDQVAYSVAVSTIANLAEGDTITFYNRARDAGGSSTPTVQTFSGQGYTYCYGHRII
jgi:PDZ domain-containing secreted protein